MFLAESARTFLPLPKLATEPFLRIREQEVFALLLAGLSRNFQGFDPLDI